MKNRTRFRKLARGCFALSLSLAEWLELEQILSTSRSARSIFFQQARRRARGWQPSFGATAGLVAGCENWLRPATRS